MTMISINKSIVILCAIYTVSHFLLLFNSGIYWDDHTIFRIDPSANINTFRQAGTAFTGYYHNFVSGLPHAAFVYRTIIFSSYLSSTVCLYKLLERVAWLDSLNRFFIAAFFSVLPVNNARITFICSPYAICHALFFLAFYVVARYLEERSVLLRLLSLVLFFASFITNSLLVYFALVLVYILYKEVPKYDKASRYYLIPLKYADYFLLAPIFWFLKMKLVKSSGVFKDYNKLSIVHIIHFPFKFAETIKRTVIDVTHEMLRAGMVFLLPFALCLLITYMMFREEESPSKRRLFTLLSIGIVSLALGLFPYLAVGLTPQVHSWSSRHLLLTPLGFSLAIIAMSQLLIPKRALRTSLAGILAVMIMVNINGYFVFQKEWYKWTSVMANMRTNEIIKGHSTFLVKDEAAEYNSSITCYRFYEYTGMLKHSFGDERRFAKDVKDRIDFESYGGIAAFLNGSYGLSDYVPASPEYMIIIEKGSLRADKGQTVRLMVNERFRKKEFDQEVADLVRLKVRKI